MESPLGLIEQSFDLRYTGWVREALNELPNSFTITDPCISGHPIVFASNGFLQMSGYSRDEVIGKNGRMFQGPETDRRSIMLIREAIRNERAMEISLLNYRKDGTPFRMLFQICPVFGKEDGRVIHFVGVQVPILRKPRWSGLRNRSDEMNLSKDGGGICGSMFQSCRREVCSDSALELRHNSALGSLLNHDDTEVETNESCEASELQKTKATAVINNIFSVLIQYSELTGKVVSRQRCYLSGNRRSLDTSLNLSLSRIKQSFVLTDVSLPDMPIVYASEAFLKLTVLECLIPARRKFYIVLLVNRKRAFLNIFPRSWSGYGRHEVLGQNCRFLSGTDTDPSTQFQMKECIQTEQACTVRVLNYRKDRSTFWNFLHISPVRNASGKVAYFVGIQIDDSGKNHETHELSPHIRQLSVVGAVKVSVRSLSMHANTS